MILAALLLAVHPVLADTALDAEQAFAEDARAIGQWAAFSKWAADHGVLVGSTDYIPAKSWAAAASREGEPARPVHWWAATSYVSCDGTGAVNTGPFFEPDSGAHGRFTSFWQLQENGDWRYTLNMGVPTDGPLPAGDAPEVRTASCDGLAPVKLAPETDTRRTFVSDDRTLMVHVDTDANFARTLTTHLWNGERYDIALIVERQAP